MRQAILESTSPLRTTNSCTRKFPSRVSRPAFSSKQASRPTLMGLGFQQLFFILVRFNFIPHLPTNSEPACLHKAFQFIPHRKKNTFRISPHSRGQASLTCQRNKPHPLLLDYSQSYESKPASFASFPRLITPMSTTRESSTTLIS